MINIASAVAIAHWPGKDTPVCDEHLRKLVGLGAVLGFQLSWTPVGGNDADECSNCATVARRGK